MSGLVIDPYRFGGFNPLSSISWVCAYWASDPSWSNPGDGNAVSSWRDGTGNGYDLAGASGQEPTFRSTVAGLNNQSAVDFDGSNDYLTSSSPSTSTPASIVVIATSIETNPGPSRNFAGGSNGGVYLKQSPDTKFTANTVLPSYSETRGAALTATCLFVQVFNTTSSKQEVNGSVTNTSNASFNDPIVNLFLGYPSNPTTAQFAFVAVYSGDVTSDGQWSAFKTWAASTYGLTIS